MQEKIGIPQEKLGILEVREGDFLLRTVQPCRENDVIGNSYLGKYLQVKSVGVSRAEAQVFDIDTEKRLAGRAQYVSIPEGQLNPLFFSKIEASEVPQEISLLLRNG